MFETIKLKLTGQKSIEFEGVNLPLTRSNEKLADNRSYLDSGYEQIEQLLHFELLNENTSILDFGCGQGRLINSLTYFKTNYAKYTGLDTSKKSVDWCEKNLKYTDKISFIHLPAANARYNPNEKGLKPFPFQKNEFDLIFLNSVFSHMMTDDVSYYLNQFHKVLKDNGKVYLTAFVEENVPAVEENPENYLEKSTGALHRVRFEKMFFFSLVKEAGFEVKEFHHQLLDRTKQSVLILAKI